MNATLKRQARQLRLSGLLQSIRSAADFARHLPSGSQASDQSSSTHR